MTPLLEVRDLRITFPTPGAPARPVDGVSFQLDQGQTLALVGESGCGKSLTGLSLLRLVPPPGTIVPGSTLLLEGRDLLTLDESGIRKVRGRRIGMVFQDPMTSLNPVLRVGDQVAEGIRAHFDTPAREARERAVALLREVGIPDPERRARNYPHQLSGGMRQRVMIAIALACEPDILIADEPTTALDVTVQAQILEILDRLRQARGMAVLLITHDLGVVAETADDVAVMYAGQVVESCTVRDAFEKTRHPYTAGLLHSLPRLGEVHETLRVIPGTVPNPVAFPSGCRFHPRCPVAVDRCRTDAPTLETIEPGHQVRCWRAAEIASGAIAPFAGAARG